MHTSLPTKILLLVILTTVLFVGTLFGTLNWVRQKMDQRAVADSIKLVESQITGQVDTLGIATQDYAHWDLMYHEVVAVDVTWLIENVGVVAVAGSTFDRAAVVDGPIENVLSWGRAGPLQPSAAYVPRIVLDEMRERLTDHGIELGYTTEFAALVHGEIFHFSGAHILPMEPELIAALKLEDVAILVFARNVSDEWLNELGETLNLSGLRWSLVPIDGQPSFGLLGADGKPVGYVIWDPPTPGTSMVWIVFPLLLLITSAFIITSLAVAIIARRNAQTLVNQEAKASRMARTDPLTGRPNRLAFNEHLQSLKHSPSMGLAILFIDINNFKAINDTVGHSGGDEIVLEVSARLGALAGKDRFFARIGGDEFVYVLTHPTDVEPIADETAEDVRARLATEFYAGGQRFDISAAQGLAIKDADNLPLEEIVRRADVAMYHAKRMGASTAQTYGAIIETASREDRAIEAALRVGLDDPAEFSICYQPIVDTKTGELVRAEALARWTSATLGSVAPDRFIAVAETSGVIRPLGRVLLSLICDDLAKCPDLRISLNVSPVELMAPDFVEEFLRVLTTKDISPSRIEVELTEGVIVENPELALFRFDLLHEAGLTTALDDFGTGFSSIGYLRKLPFDTLKIDRSFLDPHGMIQQNLELIQTMIDLGHTCGKIVVCEGLETEAEVTNLRAMGCDLFQGYYFGKPMPLALLIQRYPALVRSQAA